MQLGPRLEIDVSGDREIFKRLKAFYGFGRLCSENTVRVDPSDIFADKTHAPQHILKLEYVLNVVVHVGSVVHTITSLTYRVVFIGREPFIQLGIYSPLYPFNAAAI